MTRPTDGPARPCADNGYPHATSSPVTKEDSVMVDLLHNIHEAIALPLWVEIMALALVALSPMVVVRWRMGSTWHRSDK